jgi:hypothetical protein
MVNDNVTTAWEDRERRLLDLLEPAGLTFLYFYSVTSWILGLVAGVVALVQCRLEANRRVGKICLLLAGVNFLLIGCLVAAYVVILFLAFGTYWSTAAPAGGG